MKRVIGNVLYDTDTATEVFECSIGEGAVYGSEVLYLTRKGQFFLVLTGHDINSDGYHDIRTCLQCQNGRFKHARFRVFSHEQALDWLQMRQADGEIVIDLFPNILVA